METDDKRSNLWLLLIIILIYMIGFVMGFTTKENKVDIENHFSSVVAIASPIFIKTNTYGAYMMIDNGIELPETTEYSLMVDNIIQCESGGEMVLGDLDYTENGINITSYGVAQFQLRTFNMLKRLANKPNLDYYNEADQRWLLEYALVNDYGHLWTCYRKLYGV